jgi:hypothetical protein
MLQTHGRFDYSPIAERVDYKWPDSKRLAVYVALNIEHFPFGEGVGMDLSVPSPKPNQRSYAWREYGNRVGFWRLMQMFDELNLSCAMLVNSEIYDHAPQISQAIRTRQRHEIVGHGRTNAELGGNLSSQEEADVIREATETIRGHEGVAPAGWLGPGCSESLITPDLLKEAGYQYLLDWHCDDQPIWFRTRSGPILSVPYPMEVNDTSAMVYRHILPSDFADMLVSNFDEQLEQSANQPLVYGIALHTFVAGQPFRLRHVRRALQHVVSHAKEIWLTVPGKIAEHVANLAPGTVPGSPGSPER